MLVCVCELGGGREIALCMLTSYLREEEEEPLLLDAVRRDDGLEIGQRKWIQHQSILEVELLERSWQR